MNPNNVCIKCGIKDEPEWINIIECLIQTENHWALIRYMIGLVSRIKRRSNRSPIPHTYPYECYDDVD